MHFKEALLFSVNVITNLKHVGMPWECGSSKVTRRALGDSGTYGTYGTRVLGYSGT